MNTPRPDVTVIVPVFNRSALAAKALASVAAAASGAVEVEIIVVDDGSNAPEAKALADIASLASGSRVIRLEANAGPQVARNAGMAQALGRYVKFLDSDDVLMPGMLAKEVHLADANATDVLVSRWLRADIDDVDLARAQQGGPRPYAGNPYDSVLQGFGAAIAAVLYRREAVQGIEWDPTLRHPDDWFFLIKVLMRKPKVFVSDLVVFTWVEHRGQRQSATGMLDYARSRFRILEFLHAVMSEAGALTPARRQALADYFFRDVYVAFRYDREHYRRILDRMATVAPGYRPRKRVEGNAVSFMARRMLGHRLYVPLHVFLGRLARGARVH